MVDLNLRRASHILLALILGLAPLSAISGEASKPAVAANLDQPSDTFTQFRGQLNSCATFLTRPNQTEDSVGLPFGSNDPEVFRKELRATLEKFPAERFQDGTFYVLGTPMSKTASTQAAFEAVVQELGLDRVGVKVQILSVPTRMIAEKSVTLTEHVLERLRFFFPSLKYDYQKPQAFEVGSAMFNDIVTEIPNVIFLFSTLPNLNASLTVTVHAATIAAFNVYTKSIVNWLLRKGTNNEKYQNIEIFLKQIMFAVPFVLNYQIFGNFSKILNFYAQHGWAETLAAFPHELATFGVTQGLTVVLQALFFSQVMGKGFGSWMERQEGEERTRLARALRPFLQMPVLMLDSMVLALASSNWAEPLLQWGPFQFNYGHAGLIALTATGVFVFKKFPRALDPFITLAGFLFKPRP